MTTRHLGSSCRSYTNRGTQSCHAYPPLPLSCPPVLYLKDSNVIAAELVMRQECADKREGEVRRVLDHRPLGKQTVLRTILMLDSLSSRGPGVHAMLPVKTSSAAVTSDEVLWVSPALVLCHAPGVLTA